jgi:hypothetical protein
LAGGTARKKSPRPPPSRAASKRPAPRPAVATKVVPKKAAPAKKAAVTAKKAAPAAKRPPVKPAASATPKSPPLPPKGDGRTHVLSLSFVRDGDEFLARLETDGGQITELKNRSLDQLLTLVAGELEDLLE